MRLYYGQYKEDLFIKAFFPDVKKGTYIDVGANDPIIDSVTKTLYDEGWSGINIEPIFRHFKALQEQRTRDTNLNIGLSSKNGTLTFREYVEGDGLSTFDPSMIHFYEKGTHPFPTKDFKEYSVPVRTLKDVIGESGFTHINFIKIDVEGYEYEVIKGYDWRGVRPELICIESLHISKDWRPLLKKNDYHEVFFDGGNSYYLANESLHRKDHINYQDVVLSGNPVYYPAFLEIKNQTIESLQPQMQALATKISDQEADIAFLHRQQRDVRFLAKQLARELQVRLNRRAKGVVVQSGLVYHRDEAITHKLAKPDGNKRELVQFIRARDKLNVVSTRASVLRRLKPLPWKIAAAVFSVGLKIMKKVAKRILYARG